MRTTIVILIVLLSTTICAVAKEGTLHSPTGEADGGFPFGGVVMDQFGNIYRTTILDGAMDNANRGELAGNYTLQL